MIKTAFTVAGLAAFAIAQDSSCQLTTTDRETSTSVTYDWVTVTQEAQTETYTPTQYLTTATTTSTVPNYSIEMPCHYTSTKNVEAVSTAYSGSYSSSSLRPSTSCAAVTVRVVEYPTTETRTGTQYSYPTTTITAPTATSSSKVVTKTVTSGSSTITEESNCTKVKTVTTGTASTTSTQALKCAPTNLIGTDGIAGMRQRGAPLDGIASYGNGATYFKDPGADKDASACCQACQEDPNCAASIYVLSGGSYHPNGPNEPFCQKFTSYGNETCGMGFSVFPGDKQIAQSGSCGYVAENVYADGVCKEGDSARVCSGYRPITISE